jgi:hypothetical protein
VDSAVVSYPFTEPETLDRRGFPTPQIHSAGQECPAYRAYRGANCDPPVNGYVASNVGADGLIGPIGNGSSDRIPLSRIAPTGGSARYFQSSPSCRMATP